MYHGRTDGSPVSLMYPRAASFGLLALSLSAVPVRGAEICVICTSPPATYRCTVEGAERVTHLRGSDRVLQYVCITELAKLGGHASCSVDRRSSGICFGELKVLQAGDALAAAEAAVGEASRRSAPPADTRADGPSDEGPPRTLEELARKSVEQSSTQLKNAGRAVKETAKSAGEQIEKAGDAVGGAVKKTWTCLKSLFADC
ncbi:MAG TPA: hypothetical protein VNK52_08995 [Hyphomicrobiaceae bacterium]|nr:hypothetical protein [Hyphomicrobiaceae bacterium]